MGSLGFTVGFTELCPFMENIYKQITNNDSFTNGGSNTVMVFNLQFLSTLYYLLFIYVAYKTLDLL